MERQKKYIPWLGLRGEFRLLTKERQCCGISKEYQNPCRPSRNLFLQLSEDEGDSEPESIARLSDSQAKGMEVSGEQNKCGPNYVNTLTLAPFDVNSGPRWEILCNRLELAERVPV